MIDRALRFCYGIGGRPTPGGGVREFGSSVTALTKQVLASEFPSFTTGLPVDPHLLGFRNRVLDAGAVEGQHLGGAQVPVHGGS